MTTPLSCMVSPNFILVTRETTWIDLIRRQKKLLISLEQKVVLQTGMWCPQKSITLRHEVGDRGAGSLGVCVSKNVFQEVPGPGENISEFGHWQEAHLAIMKISTHLKRTERSSERKRELSFPLVST